MEFVTLAVAAEQPQETGQMLALLITPLVFWAVVSAWGRYKKLTGENPSPTGAEKVLTGTKPQVKAVGTTSSGTTSGRGKELDVWVGQQVGRRNTMEIVREAKRRFGASKMTVLRAIKRVGKGGAS